MSLRLLLTVFLFVLHSYGLPTVDPGLFVISGVKTCGNGTGYCLLGSDCTLDQDFMADLTGHCRGLRNAFTPAANFVCCSDREKHNEVEPGNSSSVASTSAPDLKEHLDIESIDLTTEGAEATTSEIVKDYLFSENNDINAVDAETIDASPLNTCDGCNSTVKFTSNVNQLCLGSHVGKGWVVTSATCATIVYRMGKNNIIASFVEESDIESTIKEIVIHENYRASSSNVFLPEAFNLGLVQLNVTMDGRCVPCLPIKGQKFGGQICRSLNDTTDTDDVCESEVETMLGEDHEEFLTATCDSLVPPGYFGSEQDSGKPLMCGGHLAGVESSSGIGMAVFTQLSNYMDWIRQNTQPAPMQKFNHIDFKQI